MSKQPSPGASYFSLYNSTPKSLLNEEYLQSSPRGHSTITQGTFLVEQGDCKTSVDMAVQLCCQVSELLERSKKKRKLPTAVISNVWSNFHKLQFCGQHIWQLSISHLPFRVKLLLQLLLDRLLKCLIAAEAGGCSSTAVPELHSAPTLWEQNVIEYM